MAAILNGKKVLIVATNRAIREVLSPIAKQIGATAVRVTSGPGSIADFEEFKPDLVFCHDENDSIAGLGVVRLLRQKAKAPLSIVMVLGEGEGHLSGEAVKAGANGTLMVPFSMNDVSKLTENILNKPGEGTKLRFGPRPTA